ncbi:MAG: hypothetical protein ABJO02_06625 [Reichenbachiella sp.]|uniref:hypothetical protein n=1 Tax=Reichenbachiella sp. TaxID=2184521 RepID=UPI00329873E5
MNQEIITRRLTLIKYLADLGFEQSRKPNLVAGFSILHLHDAIEMFLKLLSEMKNKKSPQSFMDYWDLFPDLTLKEAMRSLNKRRVSLKHHGQMPNQDGIEESRVFTKEFFDQNTFTQFDIQFSEISLLDLLKFENTKHYLKKAKSFLDTEHFQKSIEQSAFAFDELIEEYKISKVGKYKKDPFSISVRVSNPINPYSLTGDNKTSKEFGAITKGFNENVKALEKTIQLIALGINYRKFVKFNVLTPEFYRQSDGVYRTVRERDDIIANYENAEFCLNFVIESGIGLQEVDFEIAQLMNGKRQ